MADSNREYGKFTQSCRNTFHYEWFEKYAESYPDGSCFKLKRPKASEIQHFEKICGVRFRYSKVSKTSTKFCELCLNHLETLYTTIRCDNDQKFIYTEHDYAFSPSSGAKKRKSIRDSSLERNENNLYTYNNFSDLKESVLTEDFFQKLEISDLERIAYLLGQSASPKIQLNNHDKVYKDSSYLQNLDINDYLAKSFDKIICNFLNGLKSTRAALDQDSYNKAKINEFILHMLYPNSVFPLCFLENLLLYNKTNSRQVVDLIGSGGPHGCYDVVKEWLTNQSVEPLEFPKGDCVVVFDNNQVIGRSWKIKVNNKVKSSVVTTICQIEYPGYGDIQNRSDLVPKYWHLNLELLKKNVREIPEYISNFHYELLYVSLAEHLQIVLKQQQAALGGFSDIIDTKISKQVLQENTKICQRCGYVNNKTKRMCGNESCKVNLKQAEQESLGEDVLGTYVMKNKCKQKPTSEVRLGVECDDDGTYRINQGPSHSSDYVNGIYQHLESGHREVPPKLSHSDPCFANPNSFDSVRTVLRQIGLNAGIKLYCKNGTREWVFVVCDGLLYGLCQHVINTTFRCKKCSVTTDSYYTKEEFEAHHASAHPNETSDEFLEFYWVLLRPGNGHFEMNMFKAFVELNWEVFFSELCRVMGFKSENAQQAAKKCSDNHKTWSLLQIAYEGTIEELMVPYVRSCLQSGYNATPKGFISYALVEAKDPNYIYMATMTLTYLQSIINMRAGLRCGNVKAITTAKTIFAPLFHSRSHAKYQEIEMAESIQRHMIPEELVNFFNETESVSLTDNKTSGEGLDFKAEVVNKEVQSWMPRGVPTGDDWLRVTRNLETLKNLGEKARCLTGTTTQRKNSTNRSVSLEEQIYAWRTFLRRKEYLSHPCENDKTHNSLSSEELDHVLVNFNVVAEERRKHYFDKKLGLSSNEDSFPPVFTTKRERQNSDLITNKTKTEIFEIISKLLDLLTDKDVKDSMVLEYKKLGSASRCKKEDLLRFHEIVQDILHQQNNYSDNFVD